MKEKILALREQGKSYNQIQEELGCSKGTISYHLGVGQKAKVLERTQIKRNHIVQYVQEYKQSRGCADCKENYPYWMLEFDHLGDKDFNISGYRQITASLERVKREIAKCEVVCANCHRNRTYNRQLTTGISAVNISEEYKI